MSIKTTCPHCGHKATFNDASSGKKAKCRGCGTTFLISVEQRSPEPKTSVKSSKRQQQPSPSVEDGEIDWESISELEHEGSALPRSPKLTAPKSQDNLHSMSTPKPRRTGSRSAIRTPTSPADERRILFSVLIGTTVGALLGFGIILAATLPQLTDIGNVSQEEPWWGIAGRISGCGAMLGFVVGYVVIHNKGENVVRKIDQLNLGTMQWEKADASGASFEECCTGGCGGAFIGAFIGFPIGCILALYRASPQIAVVLFATALGAALGTWIGQSLKE